MLEEGSLTAHMTIVARAMGMPVIGRVARHPPQREDGEPILVDGDTEASIVRPTRRW